MNIQGKNIFFGWVIFFITIGNFIPLSATNPDSEKPPLCTYLGPEIYHVTRTRQGGTKQEGFMYGVHGGFDYLKRYSLYVGLEGYYAGGELTGRSGNKQRIKAHTRDAEIEARFGFTFQTLHWCGAALTPYIGYGYFQETNHFLKHHPFSVQFNNRLKYVPVGFLSSIFVRPNLNIGFNFSAKFMTKGINHISNDPTHDNMTLHMENKMQYEAELPITYQFCQLKKNIEFSLIPFYRYRHYGGKFNFPFDFLDTRFRIYGGRLVMIYRF